MVTIIGMIISHLYGDFLCMYIWSEILGRTYSQKITSMVTFLSCVLRCSLKIYSFLNEGLYTVVFSSVISYAAFIVYIIIMYRSSIGKRLSIMTVTSIITLFMDVLASGVMVKVMGSFEFMQESAYTIIYIIIGNIFITIGLALMCCILKKFEKIKWESIRYQWLSLFLPISQWFFLIHLGLKYSSNALLFPTVVVIGFILGLVTDAYMFALFYRSNQRAKAEKELRQVEHQYEIEQLRYEQLKNGQEEVSKMRHDFQNYVIAIKNME